jgi:hypothetical protein
MNYKTTMNSHDEIINGLHETTRNLLEIVSQFTQDQFNTIPYEGSWTAGQVAEHVFKSESGVPTLLNGNSKPTVRPPDQHVSIIRDTFLDFITKMKSPEFIIPTADIKDKMELYESLKRNRSVTIELAGSIDLSRTFYDFPLPGIGEMTGLEWLTFINCHSQRHIFQLKNIYKVLS